MGQDETALTNSRFDTVVDFLGEQALAEPFAVAVLRDTMFFEGLKFGESVLEKIIDDCFLFFAETASNTLCVHFKSSIKIVNSRSSLVVSDKKTNATSLRHSMSPL